MEIRTRHHRHLDEWPDPPSVVQYEHCPRRPEGRARADGALAQDLVVALLAYPTLPADP